MRAWLQKFKSLAFVPLDLVETAFNYLISLQPVLPHNETFNLFYTYFRTTWLEGSKFPPALWNHYETVGPRSNNHVEGFNFPLNVSIDCIHHYLQSVFDYSEPKYFNRSLKSNIHYNLIMNIDI